MITIFVLSSLGMVMAHAYKNWILYYTFCILVLITWVMILGNYPAIMNSIIHFIKHF